MPRPSPASTLPPTSEASASTPCSAYDVHVYQDLTDSVLPWAASLHRDGWCICNANGLTMQASIDGLKRRLGEIKAPWAKTALTTVWPNEQAHP